MAGPEPALPPFADPLSDTLHALRLNGTLYCRAELRAPWGIEIPDLDGLMAFAIITSGRAWFEMAGEAPRWLEQGSLTLIPHGEVHRISHAPGVRPAKLFDIPVERVSERYEFMRFGGGGELTRATYGVVRFDNHVARRLLEQLPKVIFHDSWDEETGGWMQSTLRFITREAGSLKPGGETVLTRLADILVIQAIRSWLENAPEAKQGWLAAMRDINLGRALAAIHRQPGKPWTVGTLAREAGMSRSAFSARFTSMTGESAMRYLTRWRMQAARALLQETGDALPVISLQTGYQSEPAFCRAFKREYGVSPGKIR
jgi:AraC-like DNA-binding protein